MLWNVIKNSKYLSLQQHIQQGGQASSLSVLGKRQARYVVKKGSPWPVETIQARVDTLYLYTQNTRPPRCCWQFLPGVVVCLARACFKHKKPQQQDRGAVELHPLRCGVRVHFKFHAPVRSKPPVCLGSMCFVSAFVQPRK